MMTACEKLDGFQDAARANGEAAHARRARRATFMTRRGRETEGQADTDRAGHRIVSTRPKVSGALSGRSVRDRDIVPPATARSQWSHLHSTRVHR
jgi:hypothetical protein